MWGNIQSAVTFFNRTGRIIYVLHLGSPFINIGREKWNF